MKKLSQEHAGDHYYWDTALCLAIIGQYDLAFSKQVVSLLRDCDKEYSKKLTKVMVAAFMDEVDAVKNAFTQEADAAEPPYTLLEVAGAGNALNVIEYLLGRGLGSLQVNRRTTQLSLACFRRNVEAVRLMIPFEHGLKDCEGNSHLEQLILQGDTSPSCRECVQILAAYEDEFANDITPRSVQAYLGNLREVVRAMTEWSLSSPSDADNLLCVAVLGNQERVARALCSYLFGKVVVDKFEEMVRSIREAGPPMRKLLGSCVDPSQWQPSYRNLQRIARLRDEFRRQSFYSVRIRTGGTPEIMYIIQQALNELADEGGTEVFQRNEDDKLWVHVFDNHPPEDFGLRIRENALFNKRAELAYKQASAQPGSISVPLDKNWGVRELFCDAQFRQSCSAGISKSCFGVKAVPRRVLYHQGRRVERIRLLHARAGVQRQLWLRRVVAQLESD